MAEFPVPTTSMQFLGAGLQHPECVVALESGDVFASDRRGGIARLALDGVVSLIRAVGAPDGFQPNGFSVLPGRGFVVANIGETGGVWSMTPAGETRPFCLEVEGRSLPGTNFAGFDGMGRTWISVSSWQRPRKLATSKHASPDGSLILVEGGRARIVAEGLAYTNEARVHPAGDWLYVSETAGRRLSRFKILANSDLGIRETVTEFTNGAFPDGMAFDVEGFCWVACIGSQQVIRVDPATGAQQLILDESTAESAEAEAKFGRGETRAWDDAAGVVLGLVSGLCFGGPDLRTVHLGSLKRDAVATFRSPISGAAPYCWRY